MSTTSVITNSEYIAVAGNLCYLLGKALDVPSAKTDPALPGLLKELAADLPAPLSERARETADAWSAALDDTDAALLAHTRLFLGPFEIKAFPYASFYLETDQKIMGPLSRTIAERYIEAGLAPAEGPREAPDHIALELEYLYFLSFRRLETDDPQYADEFEAFRREHLAAWVPEFTAAILKADEHPFYNAVARLLAAFAEERTFT